MPVETRCPNCRKVLHLDESMAGKKIRCPTCKGVIAVPASDDHLEVQWGEDGPATNPNRPIGAVAEPVPGGPGEANLRDRDSLMHKMPSFGAKKPGANLQFLIKPLVFFGVLAIVGYGMYKVYTIVNAQYETHMDDEKRDGGVEGVGTWMRDTVTGSTELEDDTKPKPKKKRK